MISHERSDLPRFKVAVPVDDYRFPESCILCGKLESVKIGATFMKVWILGSIGLWREQVVAISVCETHAEEYYRREKSRSNLMAMFFLIGILMLFLAPVLFPEIPASHSHRAETPLGLILMGCMSIVFIVFAFALMLGRSRSLPIKMKFSMFWKKGFHIYTFPDQAIMDRFLMANQERSQEK